jgi:hypothetical protein
MNAPMINSTAERGVYAASRPAQANAFGDRAMKRAEARAPILLLLFLALASGIAASAPDEGAPARPEYTGFKIITDRNIFDGARSRTSARNADDQTPVRLETITLVGTLTYEKGPYAFFDGSETSYQQVLEPGKSIAGYAITEIEGDQVKMIAGTNNFALRVGMQLRREGDGDWKVSSGSAGQTSLSPAGSSSGSSEPDDADAVVRRLMQQREQEFK